MLPTAAPVHEGAAIALNAVAPVGVTFRLNDSVDPSLKTNEKFCPETDLAVASLYVAKSSQQYVSHPAGAVPWLVADAQLCANAGVAAMPINMNKAAKSRKRSCLNLGIRLFWSYQFTHALQRIRATR